MTASASGSAMGPQRPGGGGAHREVKSAFTGLDLPGFISQVLGQYQDLMVQQVERDVQGKAMAAVREEAHLLHYDARERLRMMESKIHQGVQVLLDRGRERIFEMVLEEMEATFDQLETRLQGLLTDGEPQAPRGGGEATGPKWEAHRQAGESIAPQPALEEESPGPQPGIKPLEVRLELPPPLDLRSLVEFYRTLSAMKELRIVRAYGLIESGVFVDVRPKEPSSLLRSLRALPGVKVVADGTHQVAATEGARDHPSLRVHLIPTGR